MLHIWQKRDYSGGANLITQALQKEKLLYDCWQKGSERNWKHDKAWMHHHCWSEDDRGQVQGQKETSRS